jgi:hypothetical protein
LRVRRPVEKRKELSMRRPRTYSVTAGNETPEEPSSGIYWTHEDDEGETVFHGPYRNKWDAEESIDQWQFNQGECPHD